MFRSFRLPILGLSTSLFQVALGQPLLDARAPGRKHDLQMLQSDGHEWSKEAILTLAGVCVALFGIVVTCWVADRPQWLRTLSPIWRKLCLFCKFR